MKTQNENLTKKELKALISLLEDNDSQILEHVESKILSIGKPIIPLLEDTWTGSFDAKLQRRIEDILHVLQFGLLKEKLQNWYENQQDDLLKGLWILSTYQYPDLEYSELQVKIEQLYFENVGCFSECSAPYQSNTKIEQYFLRKTRF